MLPRIDVLIPTYNRRDIVLETVRLLRENLVYSGPLTFSVGADGRDGTADVLIEESLAWPPGSPILRVALPDWEPRGLGRNLNMLIRQSEATFIMGMDDDHHLISPLYLDRIVLDMIADPTIGWVRLMGVAGHKYRANLRGSYWHIDWDSPETYIPSMRPHIKKQAFHIHYGMYPEGYKLGETEEIFCYMCKDKAAESDVELNVCAPLMDIETIWQHVGDSWQSRGL